MQPMQPHAAPCKFNARSPNMNMIRLRVRLRVEARVQVRVQLKHDGSAAA